MLNCGYLQNNMDEQSIPMIKQFIGHMNSLDKIRGTDWKSVMPDVAELVQDYA